MSSVAIIIHGSYGNPNENWFPWLKEELKKLSYEVFVPEFPTPKSQKLESWMGIFDKYMGKLNENSILIGHSIGCAFILSVLEKLNVKIKASFLVAGFLGPLGSDFYDSISKTFAQKDFDWEKIKNNCDKFFVYQADNDPHIPLEKGQEMAKNLDSQLIIVKNAGHFNEKSGYKKFGLLLKDIKKITAKDL
ncbi:serine hydrolase family protein [Candidatus Woesearchaeota archaeon]|nr:serine hydrolase family protein [Candidatus Woesearchaeota archaeon]